MIPKIIHYCWLSNEPFPRKIWYCINSWHKYLPDYEFILWNRDRFPPGKSKWVDQAFDSRKYAFAADYIRLYALYHCGGIYLDADVEVLKTFNPFLELNTILCFQNEELQGLEVAAFGVERYSSWIKACLEKFDKLEFINNSEDGISLDEEVLPERIKKILREKNFQMHPVANIREALSVQTDNVIPVFPYYWFSPKSWQSGKIEMTTDTVCIHHFEGSWLSRNLRMLLAIKKFVRRLFWCISSSHRK